MIAGNRIKISFLALLWFMLVAALPMFGALGSVFSDPDIPDGQQIVWRVTKDGKKNSPSIITWRVKYRGGEQVYEITKDSIRRKNSKFVLSKSDMRLIEAEVRRDTADGRSRVNIRVEDDHQYLIYLEEKDSKRKSKDKRIDHELDGYNGLILPYCLRGFPFEKQKEVKFRLTPPFRPGIPFWAWKMWKSYAKPLGTETITVPAGTFECYKLEVGASGGLIKRITSKYYFWFAVEPPHQFVKYQDKDGKDITELIEIRPNQEP